MTKRDTKSQGRGKEEGRETADKQNKNGKRKSKHRYEGTRSLRDGRCGQQKQN